jgi:TonB family protein
VAIFLLLFGALLTAQPAIPDWEAALARNPRDSHAREALLRAYWNALPQTPAEAAELRAKRLPLILWLIENEPGSRLAAQPEAWVPEKGAPLADAGDFERWKQAWLTASEEHREDPDVQRNAGLALSSSSPETSVTLLKRALALDPSSREAAFHLGAVYGNALADALLQGESAVSAAVRRELAVSLDARILRMSAQTLQTRAAFAPEGRRQPLLDQAAEFVGRARSIEPDSEYQSGIRAAVTRGVEAPPVDAARTPVARVPVTVPVPEAAMRDRLLFHPRPARPAGTREGRVRVAILVNREGAVVRARAIGGPTELREAAEEAVRNWTFRPLSYEGELALAESSVEVEFRRP